MNDASAPIFTLRAKLLDSMLECAPEQGWTDSAVRSAATRAGLSAGEAELAAPRGALDLIDAFFDAADRAMLETLALVDLDRLKVRERVRLAVHSRLQAFEPNKAALRRALSTLALRFQPAEAARLAWRTSDRIWRALGDQSTDENYYSKRAILVAVLAAVTGRWLLDESEDGAATAQFLDARIAGIMRFERLKGRLKPLASWAAHAVGAAAGVRARWG